MLQDKESVLRVSPALTEESGEVPPFWWGRGPFGPWDQQVPSSMPTAGIEVREWTQMLLMRALGHHPGLVTPQISHTRATPACEGMQLAHGLNVETPREQGMVSRVPDPLPRKTKQ